MNQITRDKALYIVSMILICLAVSLFLLYRLREPVAVDTDFEALQQALEAQGLTEELSFGSEGNLKRNFDIFPSQYVKYIYYTPTDFMSVDEILLLELTEASEAEKLAETCRKRIEKQVLMFENYGTDQYSLLQEARIYQNGRYLCFCCGHHSREAMDLIRSSIER